MPIDHLILADVDGSIIKLIFFVIIFVGGWIYNAVEKWRKSQQELMPPPPPIGPAQQLEQSVAAAKDRIRLEQAQRQQQLNQARQQTVKKGRRLASQPVAPVVAAVTPPVKRVEIDSFATPLMQPKPKSASAASLHDWLTPSNLKRQFVMTEILNPPVALREPRG